jgi:hypothetical protein
VGEAAEPTLIQFSQTSVDTAERGFATAIAVFERSGSAVGTASIDYALSGGNADAGVDYQGVTSGTISWGDGDADPKWIEFAITDDTDNEPSEYFELGLSNVAGANMGAKSTLRINIGNGSGINNAPNAVAGANQTVSSGASVSLSGSQSNDPDGDTITYAWAQSAGPAVSLANANSETATFTAPTVTSDTLLRFELTVTDASGLSGTSLTAVTVNKPGGASTRKSGGGSTGLLLLALLAATGAVRRSLIRKGAAG